MPEYMTIGTNFRIEHKNNVQDFLGPVVASKDAYYLIVEMNHGKAILAKSLGGMLGIIVMKLLKPIRLRNNGYWKQNFHNCQQIS